MSLRRIALFAPSVVCVVLLVASCSKQSEGERCDVLNNDADCDSGLECVAAAELLNSEADRCCPPEGERIDDSRCRRRTGGTIGTGGGGGTASSGGAAGSTSLAGGPGLAGGGGDGGAQQLSCRYTSDCPDGQSCGPAGFCQPECRSDRDCSPGQTCNDAGSCTSGAGGVSSTGGATLAGAGGHVGGAGGG